MCLDLEPADVFKLSHPKARKDHHCHACGGTIERGRVYTRLSWVFEGAAETDSRGESEKAPGTPVREGMEMTMETKPEHEPVIPLGYERCDFEQADREDKNNNRVLLLLYSFGGTTWDEAAFCWPNAEAHKAGREIYLRCVLPPEIASHWRPAPGRTHKEQRNSAWPMGRSDHKDWFAAWAPARGTMVTKIETTTFMVSDTFIPLVPKKKP